MGEFWSAILGAVVGAVVGGAIALGIQLIALRAASNERKEVASDQKKALAHSLLFKLVQVFSHLHQLNVRINACFERAKKDGVNGAPWQIVLPVANSLDRVHFATDEMALLLALKEDELFNEIMSMDEIHNSMIDAFETYSVRRLALTDKMSAYMEGDVGTSEFTKEQLLLLQPRMAELNDLVSGIRSQVGHDEHEAEAVLGKFRAVLSEKIGLHYSIEAKSK